MPFDPHELRAFLPCGYLFTVAVELPILVLLLSPRHPLRDRLAAGFWLTACTYPVVVLVFPYVVWEPCGRGAYMVVAETFAPVVECGLFWLAYGDPSERFRRSMVRDFAAVTVANLASFGVGELLLQ